MDRLVVDVDDAGLEPLGQGQAPVGVAGEDPGGGLQAVSLARATASSRAVDDLDGGHQAEGLQPGQLAVGGHVGQQGRLEAAPDPLAAGRRLGAPGDLGDRRRRSPRPAG